VKKISWGMKSLGPNILFVYFYDSRMWDELKRLVAKHLTPVKEQFSWIMTGKCYKVCVENWPNYSCDEVIIFCFSCQGIVFIFI
jgi:hypothetical protein